MIPQPWVRLILLINASSKSVCVVMRFSCRAGQRWGGDVDVLGDPVVERVAREAAG
jgi:hypothetical protein